MRRTSSGGRGAAALALVLLAGAVGAGAGSPPGGAVLPLLDHAIAWYRQQVAQAQLADEPSDVVYADAARQQARQALELAFAFARASVALVPAPAQAAPAGGGEAVPGGPLAERAAQAQDAVASAQRAADDLERRAARQAGRRRAALAARLAEARSEVKLAQARRDALGTLAEFTAQAGAPGAASGLLGQVEELERSIPGIAGDASASSGATPAPAAAAAAQQAVLHRAAPTGIVALATGALSLSRKLGELRDGARLTSELRAEVDRARAPLVSELRALLQPVDQPAPPAGAAAATRQRAREVDQATARFKQVTAALVPLGKVAVLLDAHAATLSEWRSDVDAQWDAALRRLALHLALLAATIAAILAASSAWRSATFRYVRDLRRRRQSLLLRRIVVAAALVLVMLFSFVTELGSVATFAGFVTAGLAVALQNVILSVAAYFFLIGKYGIAVGDRVQIGGVTGDVIDIGLVRLHLMELRGDGLSTGRVVVFSNAVLFQPTANFFKQLPGSSFTWHQVTMTLSGEADYRGAERRLMDAVGRVYERFRARLEQQHDEMLRQLSPIAVRAPRPESQLHLAEGGLELTIRFPVPLDDAPAIDDEVTRALLDAIDQEPRLALAGSGTPTLRAVPDPAPA